MRSVDDLLTPDELADELFGNMDLTSNEKRINKDWLNQVFRVLKNGGVWMWPETGRTFRKVSEIHFVEVILDEEEE
tara:strand:+ start:107 stop:334 length:228 start_codon:yes stop_codon:yes gene_type:complete